ncbi:MAG: HU family DNA-binding protein [Sulfuricellaceae bacterium]|nr:HU family DNA-binding protein [Sulfuricellaceae bacterium]
MIAEISATTGQAANITKLALDAFKAPLKGALKKGGMVTLLGFGSFYVGKRAARNGRNPQTGATIAIPAAQVPKFRSSKTRNKGGKFSPASALKDAVN